MHTMLNTSNINMFFAEATPVATDTPCRHKLGNERRTGNNNRTLAQRCAR